MSVSTQPEILAVTAAATLASHVAVTAIDEWLTFRLGEEEYGIDILRVQEIRSYEKPTRIANMPGYVLGVIDLRGVIVPILDLRVRFGLPELRYDGATVTVVLNVNGQTAGVVVDSVSDVLELRTADVKAFPDMATSVDSRFITGIGSLTHDGKDRMLILLDIVSLVSGLKVA